VKTVSTKSKGKAKASAPLSEEELSANELEYDENASAVESDLSGSEFEISEDDAVDEEPSDAEDAKPVARMLPRKGRLVLSLDNKDAEEAMLEAAVRASLRDDVDGDGDVGPSYDPDGEDLPSEAEALSSDLSEDDEPLAKGQKKGGRSKKMADIAETHSYPGGSNIMTLAKLKKKKKREESSASKAKKDARLRVKQEERELIRKLGRRLIQVSASCFNHHWHRLT
jgi:hypothetical protein